MPIFKSEINHDDLKDQHYVKFNTDNSYELVTNNKKFCIFWNW